MEEPNQDIREHILHQIPSTLKALPQPSPTIPPSRILGDMPNSILNPKDYLSSIHPFISKIQSSLQDHQNTQTRFLAVRIYPGRHSYFVLDVNNTNYIYESAHEEMTPIPVYVLRLSKRRPRMARREGLDGPLVETLVAMHDGHPGDPLPFFENYNGVVGYRDPRSLG